jgi:hypothetical protein
MTRTELIKAAKEALRKEFKLPLVGTSVETAITDKACDVVFPHFSDEVLAIITSAADGLDSEEIAVVRSNIVTYVNRLVDIPWVPESGEKILFEKAVDAILAWLQEGRSI